MSAYDALLGNVWSNGVAVELGDGLNFIGVSVARNADTGRIDISFSGTVGTGDVVGPASAVADRIAVYNGTTGKLIKDGGQTIAQVLASAAATADEATLHKSGSVFSILANGVGNTQLRQGTACAVVGRSANSTGNLADISLANNDEVLMRTSNVVTSGKIADANVATAAAIAGSKITPTFGAQVVSSTSAFSFGSSPASAGAYRAGNNDFFVGKTTLGVNVVLIGVSSGDTIGVGDSSAPTVVTGSGSVSLRVGASNILQALASTVRLLTPSLSFDVSAVAPTIAQVTDTAASVTCDDLTISGQSGSGGTAVTAGSLVLKGGSATVQGTGGAAILQGGTGVTLDGFAGLRSPAGTQRVRAGSVGLALYAGSEVAQAARVGQLTDSTTGTPSTTIGDVGGLFSQSTLNNIHASFLAKINALELVIHNLSASA